MPNWCQVSVSIKGKKENVERMFNEITALQKVKREKSNSKFSLLSDDSDWLGYVVRDIFGLEPDSKEAPYCRGHFTYLREDVDVCDDGTAVWFFSYYHAWGPAINFNIMLRKHYDVQLVWESEEPGMCSYLTNEEMEAPFFTNIEGEDCSFYKTEQDMIDDTAQYIITEYNFTATPIKTMEQAAEFLNSRDIFVEWGKYELFDDSEYILPMNEN